MAKNFGTAGRVGGADGAGTYPQCNFGAAVAPAVGNDDTEGYSVGSMWYDTTADDAFTCLDAATGAAVWKQTTP